jgi:type II secretory pathway component PulK
MNSPTLKNNRGFALILTLWVLAILSVMLLTFSRLVATSTKASSYLSKDVQASALARGALKRVALELLPQEKLGKGEELAAIKGERLGLWLVDPADWSVKQLSDKKEIGALDEYVLCEITAEDSRLPAARVTRAMYAKLPNVSPVLAEAIIAAAQAGAEGADAKDGAESSRPGKEPDSAGPGLKFVEQLLLVDGVQGKVYDGTKDQPGLKDLLTIHSDGKIYINGARREVIGAIPGVDEQLAAELHARIGKGGAFERIEEVNGVLGVTPAIYKSLAGWIKVMPAFYRIRATAFSHGVHRTVEGVITLEKAKVDVIFMSGG